MRKTWLTVHRWVGLALALFFALVALTGTALVVTPTLDRWAHPEWFEASGDARAPLALEPIRQRLTHELGPQTSLTFRPPRTSSDTLWILVRGPWSGTVYIDPADGSERGRRGEHEGVYPWLFELHSALLLDDTGKGILAVLAALYILMWISGLVLWWPARWRHALKIKTRSGLSRLLFDTHRVAGAVWGVLIVVSVASGAYMAWRPISSWVTQLSGERPVAPPKPKDVPGGLLPLDVAVARAQTTFASAPIGYIQVPAGRKQAIRVRFRLPDDPHPNGLSSVWLHPVSGEVLEARRWNELDPGAKAFSVVYPLHTGALGGPLHQAEKMVSGLVLLWLSLSGVWLWWRRRN